MERMGWASVAKWVFSWHLHIRSAHKCTSNVGVFWLLCCFPWWCKPNIPRASPLCCSTRSVVIGVFPEEPILFGKVETPRRYLFILIMRMMMRCAIQLSASRELRSSLRFLCDLWTRMPWWQSIESRAKMVRKACRLMSLIWAASRAQSSSESWIKHSESVQR